MLAACVTMYVVMERQEVTGVPQISEYSKSLVRTEEVHERLYGMAKAKSNSSMSDRTYSP